MRRAWVGIVSPCGRIGQGSARMRLRVAPQCGARNVDHFCGRSGADSNPCSARILAIVDRPTWMPWPPARSQSRAPLRARDRRPRVRPRSRPRLRSGIPVEASSKNVTRVAATLQVAIEGETPRIVADVHHCFEADRLKQQPSSAYQGPTGSIRSDGCVLMLT